VTSPNAAISPDFWGHLSLARQTKPCIWYSRRRCALCLLLVEMAGWSVWTVAVVSCMACGHTAPAEWALPWYL